ncbi:TetR family transcriptional regulator [Virgibacillus sp. NKC19-16]|uniref:TetR/AcrR family transcriptional regulator n=1 Tax=Virgibacillus salidurans TaxID=2831673 RepID=UPI001F372F1E|nr:TetR/AcrR family transcriptional regulator [Virgibacillus sp. NKC19-16]UJL46297.1 TetR family transcriptional regulator [Virgibacillus sp. NKC19-16]
MPKQTFYKLPENKRQTLIHAAEKEFSRVPLFEASISNIVKSAEIPRGSFYQYFKDKDDAFFYLLNDQAKKRRAIFVHLLNKYDGDIFDAMGEIFRITLQESKKEENLNFLRNAFLNMTHKIEDAFTRIFSDDDECDDQHKEISRLINKERLNISGDEELFYVMQILTSVTFRNFIEKFAKELSDEEAMRNYATEMHLLKKGLHK